MSLFQNSVLRNHLQNINKQEVEEAFEAYQKELLEIKTNIDTTDKQIETMVYALYNLSDDEVVVVENSTK